MKIIAIIAAVVVAILIVIFFWACLKVGSDADDQAEAWWKKTNESDRIK